MRDRLMAGLQARGIACQAYFPCVHLQPYFKDIKLFPARPLPHSEAASQRCLALPFFPTMTRQQIDEVCGAIRDILSERPAVAARQARMARVRGAA
jgi:perosamine synthetase